MRDKKQVVVEFDQAAYSLVRDLQVASGAGSKGDVLRAAIGFYAWARDQIRAGYTVGAFQGQERVKEVLLPFGKER